MQHKWRIQEKKTHTHTYCGLTAWNKCNNINEKKNAWNKSNWFKSVYLHSWYRQMENWKDITWKKNSKSSRGMNAHTQRSKNKIIRKNYDDREFCMQDDDMYSIDANRADFCFILNVLSIVSRFSLNICFFFVFRFSFSFCTVVEFIR